MIKGGAWCGLEKITDFGGMMLSFLTLAIKKFKIDWHEEVYFI